MVRVWDRPVRVLHWAIAASVALAWATTVWFSGWHEAVGYCGFALLVARCGWGFVGPRHARFAGFVRGPGATLAYSRLALAGRAPRYLGHNPLGACMVVALFACLAALAGTGWLYRSDAFWGDETVERIHRGLAWTVVALAVVHVVGVLVASRSQGENLIAAMLHGRKRAPAPGDVD